MAQPARLLREVERSGFDATGALIHLFIGGSELHGAKVGATDDLDIYGIYLESPDQALGLESRPHFVWSTASDEHRNGPDDVDVTLYSLRRWAELAAKGNATALHFVFAHATAEATPLSWVWQRVEARRELFLSRHSSTQFLGFAENQLKRITGEKGSGAKGQRHEYIGRYGYDTKAAMHCLRLYLECRELMRDGHITLPRPEVEILVAVRSGELTLAEVEEYAAELRAQIVVETASSRLPENVDREAISALIAEVHLGAWEAMKKA